MAILKLVIILMICGVYILLLSIGRTLRKIRNQLPQAFEAITTLAGKDMVKVLEQNQPPMGRLHQYEGYVIKIMPTKGGFEKIRGFEGIIYNNSMKEVLETTVIYPSQDEALSVSKVQVDYLVIKEKETDKDDKNT